MRLAKHIHLFSPNNYELWVFDTHKIIFVNYVVIDGIIKTVKASSPEIKKEFPQFINVRNTPLEELNNLLETYHLIMDHI